MKKLFILMFFIFTSILTLLVLLFPSIQVEFGYELLWIHPITYLFVYCVFLHKLLFTTKYSITVIFFIILSWLRYVAIPFSSVYTGIYNGISYFYVGRDSIQLAILLSTYELFTASILLNLLVNRSDSRKLSNMNRIDLGLYLRGNKLVYFVFILASVLLYFSIGKNLNLIQFFVISINEGQRYGDISSTSLVFLRQIFVTSLIFYFVWFVSYCKSKFEKTKKTRYVNYAIILAILNLGVIIGERRTAQIYTAFILIYILSKTFGKYKKRIILSLVTTGILVVLFMSIYKHFYAFAFGSYSVAISQSNFDMRFVSTTLQAYLFGTQNVALAIKMNESLNLSILNLLYDFGRSVFGLSFLLKDRLEITSQLFNTFIYGKTTATGHVISGIGYGYIYLGALFSPAIVWLNIFISVKLEKWLKSTKSYEMMYIVGYILIRFTTNLFATTPPLISSATIMFFSAGLVYYISKRLNFQISSVPSLSINNVSKRIIVKRGGT